MSKDLLMLCITYSGLEILLIQSVLVKFVCFLILTATKCFPNGKHESVTSKKKFFQLSQKGIWYL